ncbi:MAG: hypothetical protein IPG88_12960 [Gemmatimonadetes bacterium]|nr:hypothetical protein [Gemmatimonadota bacterium]
MRDLTTGRERILVRGLDRDRQMSPSTLGASPAIAWHPDGTRLFVAVGGHVTAVNATTGQADRVAFTARVEREASETIRFAQVEPHERATTRGHRWGAACPGILYEALATCGWRATGAPAQPHPLGGARDEPHRRPRSGALYYAAWTDDSRAPSTKKASLDAPPLRLTSVPAQYGSIASPPTAPAWPTCARPRARRRDVALQ